jgi:hypothetical protein
MEGMQSHKDQRLELKKIEHSLHWNGRQVHVA